MRSIQKLLNAQGTLTQLHKQLAQQERLAQQVRALLPSPLDEQLLAAVLNGRVLSLLVSSPVWASRLRYLAPQLLRQLRQQGLPVEQLRPRILPARSDAKRPARHHRPGLSPESANVLRQAADALEAGPLQEALRRLSRHHRK
ncbi:MAG: DciA family protein [Candidatus Thiodiazotropha sp.]